MMGYLKFPVLNDYYRIDQVLGTQIANLMEQKTFEHFESSLELSNHVF